MNDDLINWLDKYYERFGEIFPTMHFMGER